MTRRIVVATLIWQASMLMTKVVGLLREAVLGRVLGGGKAADIYWASFIVPDFLYYLLAAGALSIVFIPIFGAYIERGDEDGAWESFSAVANVLLLLLVLTLPVLWVLMPRLAALAAPGFDAEQHRELVYLSRIVLFAQVFHFVGGLLSAALQARDRHAFPALAPLVYNAFIIGGGLIGRSAEGFAWGVLVGAAAGPFGLVLLGNARAGLRWRPILPFAHRDVRTYLLRSLPIMLGFSIVIVDDWLLRRQGSLVGEGGVATLSYAKALIRVPVGVFGFAAALAAYPTVSRLAQTGRPEEAHRILTQALQRMLVLALGAQVALTCAGTEISIVVYGGRVSLEQHGDIGLAIAIYSLALWAWAGHTVVARAFYALGRTWPPTLVGTVVTLASVPLYVWGGEAHGTAGLAVASSCAISVHVFTMILLMRRAYPGVEDRLGRFALRAAPATALGIGAGFLAQRLLAIEHALLRGFLFAAVGGLVYVAAAWILRVPEARDTLAAVAKKLAFRRSGRGG